MSLDSPLRISQPPGANIPHYKWKVLALIAVGTLMAALDVSIVNVSIPAIMRDFNTNVDAVQWVVTGYMLAFAVSTPLSTWFRDRIGHKRIYFISLIVFTLGSALCGLAWDLPTLVIARLIQAVGGGALTPTGMAMMSEVFEPQERGRAMGYWGVGVIVGPAFGPTLGGYLTANFGWPSIFLVNVPIGALALWGCTRILVNDKPKESLKRPFDYWGFGALSIFLITFLLAISHGSTYGWTSTTILSCIAIAFTSFIVFLRVESKKPDGIIDFQLFRSSVFTASICITAIRSMVFFGGVFLLPLFLQQVKGLDELQCGLMLLPGSLVIAAFMPVAGRLSEKFGPRYLAIFGLSALALFMFMYWHINANSTDWQIIAPTIVRGIGLPFLMAPVMATMLNSVPKYKTGMASSIMNLVQQTGGSLGIAILATVLSGRIHHQVGEIAKPAQASVLAHTFSTGHTSLSAAEQAFQEAFLLGGILVLLAFIIVPFLPAQPPRKVETSEALVAAE